MIFKRGLVISLLFFILISPAYAALGIGPAKIEFNFVPGSSYLFDYIVSSDKPDQKILLYLEGDLAEYGRLSKESLRGPGSFRVHLDLPESIDTPGRQTIVVGAREDVGESDSFLGSAINIRALIRIHVPFPGRYAEVDLGVENVNEGEDIPIEVKIINRGRESLHTDVSVDFFNSANELVDTVTFNGALLEVGTEKKFSKLHPSEKLTAGDYSVVATADYGETNSDNVTLRVGSLFVEIKNHSEVLFKDKGIDTFYVDIQSRWNTNLDAIFAEVNISKDANTTSFRTPPIDLKAWQSKRINSFVETDNLILGENELTVTLKYLGEESAKQGTILVRNQTSKTVYIIIGVVAVVVIALIILFFVYKRRKKHGKKK